MIQIKNEQLIITIPCNNNTLPLENLADIQEALQNVFQLIDYKNSPKNTIEFTTNTLSSLLKNFAFSREQMSVINNEILSSNTLKEIF